MDFCSKTLPSVKSKQYFQQQHGCHFMDGTSKVDLYNNQFSNNGLGYKTQCQLHGKPSHEE